MFKKIISLVMVISTLLSLFTPAFAHDNPEISPEALRVSEEYAKIYPNGVFEFVSLQYDVEEDAGEFDVIIARRGGTEGKAEVDFRVIEVSAKYNEDFIILMPAWYGYETLKKEVNTKTLLELSLEENNDGIVAPIENDLSLATTTSGITTSSAIIQPNTETNQQETEIESSVPVYRSSLHELRDKASGTVTPEPELKSSPLNIFDIEDPKSIQVGDALNTLMPGATGHLIFEDGENYKTIRVKIIDDELFEGPEQFTLGLYEPKGGAVLGDSFNTVVNINNNDKGAEEIIGFDSEEYYVNTGENEAALNIVRTGETNTYAKIELSTLSGTAKADEHYVPIITEVMFLPGEQSKKVIIPILANDASETLSFKMAITEDNEQAKGINRAKIYIYPDTAEQKVMSFQSNSKLMSAPARIDPWIYVYADEFAYEGSIAKSGSSQWDVNCFEPIGRARQMPLRDGWYRRGSMLKWLDLRGINYINWKWNNSGDNGNNNLSRVTLNNKSDEVNGKFDSWGQAGSGAGINFEKKDGSWIRFENETWWSNYGNLRIDYVGLQRQNFKIKIEGTLDYYNVWNDETFVSRPSYNPGTVRTDINDPYRDETVYLIPDYTSEGKLREDKLIGYIIKMSDGSYSKLIRKTNIQFTSDFIETYIYNNGRTPNSTELTIKPYFGDSNRTLGVNVKGFDSNKGIVRIGDKEYNNETKIFENFVSAGDELTVYVTPKAGYKVSGIAVYRNNSLQPEIIPASSAVNVILSQYTSIEPLFENTSKDIYIKWAKPSADGSDEFSQNIVKGMILHDKPNFMPIEEKSILYRSLSAQPVRENYPDDKTFNEAMSSYIQSLNNYSQQIQNNYAEYRNEFNGTYNIKSILEGDVVTLYAKPIDGYTVQWKPEYEIEGEFISKEDMQKIQPYYGSSFSFEVTPDLKGIKYYFSKVNNSGYPIAKGKVVRSKQTIKHPGYDIVDQRNSNTYDAVPEVEVSVAVADGNNTKIIDGVTYKTTAKTNEKGEFQIYLPYSAVDNRYSLKMMYGGRYVPTYIIGPEGKDTRPYMLELPFMDTEYRVYDMNITGEIIDKKNNFIVPIEDKNAVITVKTSKNIYHTVYGVKVISYDSLGNLWDTWDLTSSDMETWEINIPNKMEAFKDGGRLTVELYDSGMVSKGEMESGYVLELPPTPASIKFPDVPDYSGGVEQEPFGNIDPEVDLGEVRSLIPKKRSDKYGTYSIAVGTGGIIKQLIEDNVQGLDEKTVSEKLNILTQYIQDGEFSKNLINKDFKPKNSGSVKSGRGKGNITVNFDIGFYIQLTKAKQNDNTDAWYFDYTIIYIAAELKARQDFNFTISGIPVYVTLTGGGSARGLIMAEGNGNTKIDVAYGYFPTGGSLVDITYYGQMRFNLNIGIGAGVGRRGVLSVGVSGKLDFDVGYQPWEAAKGVLTFALNVDIDVLIVPISFKVYEHTWDLFTVGNYNNEAWLPTPDGQNRMFRIANAIAKEEGTATVGQLDRTTPSAWNSTPSNQGVKPIESIILQTDIYKHPEPEMIDLNGGKKMLFYINEDPDRIDNERTAVYYSIYNYGETGRRVWNEPILLQDDRTGDYDLNVKTVGNKIAVLWSSHENEFSENSKRIGLEELLSYNDIYMQLFNLDGEKIGDIVQLTFDDGSYSNSLPKITYDEITGNMMVFYKKTDYFTEGVDFNEDEAEKIGDFLNNSYSTLVYRIYDRESEKWQTEYNDNEISYIEYEKENGKGALYGQRFIDFGMQGILPPKINEFVAASNKGKVIITYALDIDQDINTKEDVDLFMMVYDFSTGEFAKPIRITDDLNPDINPKEIEYDNEIYLFWNNDGYISYINLDSIIDYGLMKEVIGEEIYYYIKDDYNFFNNVMEEQNYEAAESFCVTIGEDGSMYVVWNESELALPENASSTDDAVKSRHMYISMYDAKYDLVGSFVGQDEKEEYVYKGAWGNKWKLTEIAGENNNEQAVLIDKDGTITVVNRKYKIISDESTNNSKDTKESPNSSLIVRTYEPITTLSITEDDIDIFPQYPKAGEAVKLTANVENYGFKPSQHVIFKFEIFDDTDGYIQLGENQVIDSHLASGKSIFASTYFTMPNDISDVRIRVTAWEEGLESSSEQFVYKVKNDSSLEVENLRAYYYTKDSIRVQASIINSGNVDAENVMFIMESFNDEEYMRNFMKKTATEMPIFIKTTCIGDENNKLNTSDIFIIDELIDVKPSYINENGDISLRVRVAEIKSDKSTEAYNETILISMNDPHMDTEISDIIINEGIDIRMRAGETANINARIIPYEANNAYALNYTSLTPEVAEIEPSTGKIFAKQPGVAEIEVDAVSLDNSFFLAEDGILYDAAGRVAEFEEDGSVKRNEDEPAKVIKASKSIFVYIADNYSQDDNNGNDKKTNVDVTKNREAVVIKADDSTLKTKTVKTALEELKKESQINKLLINSSTNSLSIEREAAELIKSSNVNMEISLKDSTIIISQEVLERVLLSSEGKINISINKTETDEGRPVVDIKISSDNKAITDFGGNDIIVTVPYILQPNEDENSVVVYYVDNNGTYHIIVNGQYNNGMVTFKTNHLSKFEVGYNQVIFDDVTGWAEEYINYLAARNIINGVGNKKFLPQKNISRAEFVKLLFALSSDEISKDWNSTFMDVSYDEWYAPYITWAAKNGYVLGMTETIFAPNENITREQMAVIIHRFAASRNINLYSSEVPKLFDDSYEISAYAKESVNALSSTDIISGKGNNRFEPKQYATRAEGSKMLTLLLRKILN